MGYGTKGGNTGGSRSDGDSTGASDPSAGDFSREYPLHRGPRY